MRILFADDDPGIQAVARIALERVGGFTVELCSSGSDVLKAAPAFAPDLILLDVTMPGMSGIETLEELRKISQTAGVPVVFLTANTQQDEIEHYRRLGAIGVIAKPFDPMELSPTINGLMKKRKTGSGTDAVKGRLVELRKGYARELPEKVRLVEESWQALLKGRWNEKDLEELERMVHNLSGSGRTFGFPEVSTAARELEICLKAVMKSGARPADEKLAAMAGLLESVRRAVGEPENTEAGLEPERLPIPPDEGIEENRLVFLIERDEGVARDLSLHLGYFGYRVNVFSTGEGLRDAVVGNPPAALISDISSQGGGPEEIEVIRRLHRLPIPVIFTGHGDDFGSRLRAVRAGGEAYFTRPLDIGRLIDKLDSLMVRHSSEPYRILIADDEPALAEHHDLILRQAGMETAVVTNPMDILESLSEFRPELILMDVYMPGCSGMEVAKIIRQKDAFVSTPIVFLSAETDVEKQLAAMSLGGDDFLTKPILPWHLVSAVTARIERHRILRSFMIRDSLTGLLNHTKTKEQLDIEVAHAERRHSDLSFAMIDLDHFKSVNDTYGHVTGDKVLKSLSRLLRQRLRKTDIVGRYGGEEFGLVLVDMNGDTAVRILDEIREDFAKIRHYSREADFSVTFSCGVASFPRYRTRSRLNEAADKALYEAKRRGRNCVVLAADGGQGSQ